MGGLARFQCHRKAAPSIAVFDGWEFLWRPARKRNRCTTFTNRQVAKIARRGARRQRSV